MKLTFLGAAREVTGSMHLLELEQGKLLIDCGFVQGRRQESARRNRDLPQAALSADAVLLTHAHIDHSGSLPTLYKNGFTGPVYTTPATRDLCAYMLLDSAHIQAADAMYLNRKYEGDPDYVPVEPIYDEENCITALEHFVGISYHAPFQPLPGVTARFLDAGHILGSAQVVLDIEERGQHHRIVFSGDLGRKGLPIIRDPEQPETPIHTVVMESTYGNRRHSNVEQMHDDLERVINETKRRGGKVIIPAFAVGRTQELIYALSELVRAGRVRDVPVFIDSPLAINVTEVFKLHPECFDVETRTFLEEHGDPFGFKGVQFITAREDSIRLNDLAGPAVIISAAGMAEAGRVLHHLRNNVENERNTILIVGFMAQHTLGRRIVERRPRLKIWGIERDLHAKVEVLDAFSAHADSKDLLDYAEGCGRNARFFLVHGEPESQEPLRATLEERGFRVDVPERNGVYSLD